MNDAAKSTPKPAHVPKGVAHVPVRLDGPPLRLVFLLLPDFSLLAFSAALETLRIANQLAARPLCEWRILSTDGQPVACSGGLSVAVDGAMGTVAPEAMVFICAGTEPEKSVTRAVGDWLRRLWRMGHPVGGLCTGAYALARAGLLSGRAFTLHWENIAPFRATHPGLEPLDQLYCIDGRIYTCAGGAAATDLFLAILRQRHGAALADTVLSMSLHGSQREGSARQRRMLSPALDRRNPRLSAILRYIESHFTEMEDIAGMADQLDLSRRQIERLFREHLKTTPWAYVTRLRLERARGLLTETGMPLGEVALACGFASSGHLTRSFRKVYGIHPNALSA